MTDHPSSPAQLKDACGALAELRALTPKDFKAYHAVIDKAEAALSQGGSSDAQVVREALDSRQRVVVEWGERCFGRDHMLDKIVRAARFFEEAAELAQAVGLPRDHALRAFDHVYSREAGDPKQEAGGVANTLMALCGALGLSFDECQQLEIARCLAKDPSHFAKRNEAKLREVDSQGGSSDQSAKSYVERAIASYAGDPADNQFQKGFLAALEVVRDEAFLPMWRTDFESAPSPCLGWCTPPSGDEVRQIWRSSYNKGQWSAHGCTQTVKAWQPLPTLPASPFIKGER